LLDDLGRKAMAASRLDQEKNPAMPWLWECRRTWRAWPLLWLTSCHCIDLSVFQVRLTVRRDVT